MKGKDGPHFRASSQVHKKKKKRQKQSDPPIICQNLRGHNDFEFPLNRDPRQKDPGPCGTPSSEANADRLRGETWVYSLANVLLQVNLIVPCGKSTLPKTICWFVRESNEDFSRVHTRTPAKGVRFFFWFFFYPCIHLPVLMIFSEDGTTMAAVSACLD